MRSAWFEHVRKTRKKMSRGQKEQVSHRKAMQHASSTWPKEKEKVLRKQKRAERQNKKAVETVKTKHVQKNTENNE